MGDQQLIAVVDDEPVWLASLGRALERAGYRTLPIADSTQAVELVAVERPAAMIVDYSMPWLAGDELASELHKSLGDECPPLILVTGDLADLGTEARSLFAACFQKPVSLHDLLAELQRVIHSAKSSSTLRRPAAVRARMATNDPGRSDDGSATG